VPSRIVRVRGGRIISPGAELFDQAGRTLQRLREAGCEVRRASLVNDVLIALSARALGATVLTADEDYESIRAVVDFKLERVAP
jgi:predicted nucleic acid-binding protein